MRRHRWRGGRWLVMLLAGAALAACAPATRAPAPASRPVPEAAPPAAQ